MQVSYDSVSYSMTNLENFMNMRMRTRGETTFVAPKEQAM